jgi:hypothetical protein
MSDLLEVLARRTLAESELINSSVFVMDFGASTPIQGSPMGKNNSPDSSSGFHGGDVSSSVFLSPTINAQLSHDASPELSNTSERKLDFQPDGSRSKIRRACRLINRAIWRYILRRRFYKRNLAAQSIQLFLKSRIQYRQKLRMKKFIMNRKWSFYQANKVFSLLLGHRVRRIMRLPVITHAVKAIRELATVIADIPSISSRDAFATSLSNQVLLLRSTVWSRFFNRAVWVAFPSPGFWDINNMHPQQKRQEQHTFSSGVDVEVSRNLFGGGIKPAEKYLERPSVGSSPESSAEKKKLQPVALSVLLKNALQSADIYKEAKKSESISPYPRRSDPDERHIKPALSEGIAILSSSAAAEPGPIVGRRSLGEQKGKKSNEKIFASSKFKESNRRNMAVLSPVLDGVITAPEIDLHIHGASKLIPASKVSYGQLSIYHLLICVL